MVRTYRSTALRVGAAALLVAGLLGAAGMPATPAAGTVGGGNGGGRILFTGHTATGEHLWWARGDGSGLQQLTFGSGEHDGTMSPDGERIAYTMDGRVHVMTSEGRDARAVTPAGTWGREPTWSADGRTIAYNDGLHLLTVPADGSAAPRAIVTAPQPSTPALGSPAYSPRGDRIAFVMGDDPYSTDVYTVRPDGTDVRRVVATSPREDTVDWSPDGRWLVVTRFVGDQPDLWLVTPDGTSQRRLTATTAYEYNASFSPDSSRVVFGRAPDTVYSVRLDGTDLRRVVDGIGWVPNPEWGRPYAQRIVMNAMLNGQWGQDILWLRPDGTDLRRLTDWDGFEGFGMLMPNGRQLLVMSYGGSTHPDGLWLVPRGGGTPTRLLAAYGQVDVTPVGTRVAIVTGEDLLVARVDTASARLVGLRTIFTQATGGGTVRWSPDGRRIAFSSSMTGDPEVYVINADGTGLRRLTSRPGYDTVYAWSRDGRILYGRVESPPLGDGGVLWTMRPDGTDQRQLSTFRAYWGSADYSPDGRWIVASDSNTFRQHLYLMRSDGTGLRQLTDNATAHYFVWPRWGRIPLW